MAETILYLIVPPSLILLGLVAGKINERNHLRDMERREALLTHILVTDLRTTAPDIDPGRAPALVIGEVVIATDYLKTFLAGLRGIFGGELGSFLTLVTRARKEALLRLKEEAHRQGYNAICNVRMDPADIGGNTAQRGIPMVAMIASGTAYSRSASDYPYRG